MNHSSMLGGSSAERRYYCASSFDIETRPYVTRPPESTYAARGTKLHEAITVCIEEGHANPEGISPKDTSEAITPCLDFLNKLVDEYKVNEYHLETELHPEMLIPDTFGTADYIGYATTKPVTLMVDWKFGRNVTVSARDNMQLAYYAIALTYSDMHKDRRDQDIKGYIVQPNGEGGVNATSMVYTPKYLEHIKERLEENYEDRFEATPVAGDWCRWCVAKPFCVAKRTPEEVDNNIKEAQHE